MLNFAVIGVGRMGSRHVQNLYKGRVKNVRLTAVCDVDETVLEKCKKKFPKCAMYADYKQLIDELKPDGIVIATPNYSHEEIAVYAIEHGVNTLIEKPISVTTARAKHIAAAAAARPDVLAAVSYNQRSNKMYIHAKQMLSDGTLGNIQRVNFIITNWYRSQAYYDQGGWRASFNGEGGGCLINQCIHQLDILQWLIGLPKKITATTRTVGRNISTENDVTAILSYDDFDCTFTASTHEMGGINRLEIVCDKGRLVIYQTKMEIFRHTSEREINAATTQGYGFAKTKKSVYRYGFFRLLADAVYGQQLRSVRAFANAVENKGKPLAYADEGYAALEIINGIYLSNATGAPVNIPLDDEAYERFLADATERELKKL